jgi:2-polyprenyl-3-methyl-5-hydroxy-6-metoxy-1,4-benzoquinol methylase
MNTEILEKVASKLNTHEDFDSVLSYFTAQKFLEWTHNKDILEAGCSTGVITEYLINSANRLDILEGSSKYAQIVSDKFGKKINAVYVDFFEKFKAENLYDVVLFGNVFHHLDAPQEQLQISKGWIKDDGIILITVPNMNSFHRRLGVESGMIKDVYDTTERNDFFVQPGRFDKQRLEELVENTGFEILESSAFFMKPFSHEMMLNLNLNQIQLEGLNKMGQKFPDLASQLFIAIKKK